MDKKLLTALFIACGAAVTAIAGEPVAAQAAANPMLYPQTARPFGASLTEWAERSAQWVYAQPFAQNPAFDATGANCAVGQSGPVWFLATIMPQNMMGGSRSCTIPRDKAILLQIGHVTDTYPCSFDPSFHPAPGQSLYDFLEKDSWNYLPPSLTLDVSLDGRPVRNALDYQVVSEALFDITGHPSLQSTYDPCITGAPQPALVNGWFMLFKKLAPGQHTLVRKTVNNVSGQVNVSTYNLTVQ